MATSFCSRCGAGITPDAKFCARCGAALLPAGSAAPGTPPAYPSTPTYGETGYDSGYESGYFDTEDRPTGAGVLSILGGIIILLGGIAEMALGSAVSNATLGAAGSGIIGLGALGFLMGFLILIIGILLLTRSESTGTYGILVIVFSFISLVSFFGGFFIGFLLALIGGILALKWNPRN